MIDTQQDHRTLSRRRGHALEEAILAAAVAELSENGYAALSIQAVARRAGASKASLYRRWETRAALIMDAVYSLAPPPDPAGPRFAARGPARGPSPGGARASGPGRGGDARPARRVPSGCRDGIAALDEAWRTDEFVMDPSRLTLHIGNTGVDGDTFKHKYLMDLHGIQINKTSRNTVLFMTNIGTSRSAVAYLIDMLVKLAEHFEDERAEMSPHALAAHDARVAQLVAAPPPLPDFSRFADRDRSGADTVDRDIRTAYFTASKDEACGYLMPQELIVRVLEGEEVVSAGFVTPYPPGFPILVLGQVFTQEILSFMAALDTREIHGFDAELGFRVLTGFPEPKA